MSLLLARHVGWNVIGTALPAVAGLVSMPVLVRVLDADRLGAFTLALGLAGLSGLLDLGLGRSLTRHVADARGKGETAADFLPTVRRVLLWLAAAGAILGAALWASAAAVTDALLDTDGAVATEFASGLRWIALSLPFALVGTGIVGTLEGLQRFGTVNAIRAPLNALLFIAPVTTLFFTRRLDVLIGVLAAVRVVGFAVWWVALRPLRHRQQVAGERAALMPLAKFGGWLTVSNVIGPLMVYGDRFYLATIFPPGLLAQYTVPLDAVSRASSLPAAAANALFPALAHNRSQTGSNAGLIRLSGVVLFALWFLPIAIVIFFARELILLWLGASFPQESTAVLEFILIGVFCNGFAHAPLASLHAGGRSDLSAKMHALEFPLYAAALVLLVQSYGVVGAAMAWAARMAFDTGALFFLAAHVDRASARAFGQIFGLAAAAALVLMLVVMFPSSRHWLIVLAAFPMLWAWTIGRSMRSAAARR